MEHDCSVGCCLVVQLMCSSLGFCCFHLVILTSRMLLLAKDWHSSGMVSVYILDTGGAGSLESQISDARPIVSVTCRSASLPCGRGSVSAKVMGSCWSCHCDTYLCRVPSLRSGVQWGRRPRRPAPLQTVPNATIQREWHSGHTPLDPHHYYRDLNCSPVSSELWIPRKSAPSSPSSPTACSEASSATSSRGSRPKASNSSAWSWWRWVQDASLSVATDTLTFVRAVISSESTTKNCQWADKLRPSIPDCSAVD